MSVDFKSKLLCEVLIQKFKIVINFEIIWQNFEVFFVNVRNINIHYFVSRAVIYLLALASNELEAYCVEVIANFISFFFLPES